ncbi:MAG: AAA family ATPase, partial [Deltaproteobacteria bacterium]|nr:AAA family ATPase [Deltaproteobacteria bacterium]
MELFDQEEDTGERVLPPLAERIRPRILEDFVGQEHLVGKGRVLYDAIQKDRIFSMIFWGDPGVGKTTLARIIAAQSKSDIYSLSAVSSGVKELREIIRKAGINRKSRGRRTILFIDEVHHFNKSQQDALLSSVEDGTVIFIGSTTENPSFEIIPPLLSRCRVLRFEPLGEENLLRIL